MSLWQTVAAIGVVGGAAYTYFYQPMALELGVPRAQCWWDGGVYLRSTAKETQYAKLMSSTPELQLMLKNGAAVGCFNEGSCAQTPNQALGALEQQMLAWTGTAGGNLLAGNVLGMLGMRAEDTARAKQTEAQFCLDYLSKQRKEIMAAAPQPAQ